MSVQFLPQNQKQCFILEISVEHLILRDEYQSMVGGLFSIDH